ncbi:MAG: hypothetical protein ACLGQH_08185 [Acidobacteriota bacterium]
MPTVRRFARPDRTVVAALLALCAAIWLAACSLDKGQYALHAMLEKERLVESTRLSLLLAVAAEKNAVLSASQSEAAAFVDQARQGMAAARDDLARLTELVNQGGDAKELAALVPVTADFIKIAAVDAEIMRLIGRNTNLRAALTSRTAAAQALERFREALAPLADGPDCPAAREALRAIAAGYTILALHAPHIEESTEAGMDALEARITALNDQVDAALNNLATATPPADQASLDAAKADWSDFWRITREILKLSRENTNIHALALVMGEKRLVTAKSIDDLAALLAVVESREFKATR